MAYVKTEWINNQSPALDATNLNHIEQGILEAHEGISAVQNDIYTKNEVDALLVPKLIATNYSTNTTGGTVKTRIDGTTLYITTNGLDA